MYMPSPIGTVTCCVDLTSSPTINSPAAPTATTIVDPIDSPAIVFLRSLDRNAASARTAASAAASTVAPSSTIATLENVASTSMAWQPRLSQPTAP